MTCAELKNLLNKISINGIKSLSNEDIMSLVKNCCDTHNTLCDCGDDLIGEIVYCVDYQMKPKEG